MKKHVVSGRENVVTHEMGYASVGGVIALTAIRNKYHKATSILESRGRAKRIAPSLDRCLRLVLPE